MIKGFCIFIPIHLSFVLEYPDYITIKLYTLDSFSTLRVLYNFYILIEFFISYKTLLICYVIFFGFLWHSISKTLYLIKIRYKSKKGLYFILMQVFYGILNTLLKNNI
jgi:hypothetical protein